MTQKTLQNMVADYLDGIKYHPRHFKTSIKAIKAYRKIYSLSITNKRAPKKASENLNKYCTIISNVLAYRNIGRENTATFIFSLSQQLADQNITI
jgi:hypothetical protein